MLTISKIRNKNVYERRKTKLQIIIYVDYVQYEQALCT